MDTVKNEYLMHAKICEWLAQSDKPVAFQGVQRPRLRRHFLTPGNDPWLGLAPADAFSAIDNGGICPPAVAA